MNIKNLVTCKGNGIFAIIGRDELDFTKSNQAKLKSQKSLHYITKFNHL